MRNFFKESEHLVRMALTLAAFVMIFLVIRHAVVPRTFGDLGHYRAAALDDIRARPISSPGKRCVKPAMTTS